MRYWNPLRVVPALAVLVSTVLFGLAPSASADDYMPAQPTTCNVAAKAAVAGDRIQVRLEVLAAGAAPTGTAVVTFRGGDKQTLAYSGAAVTVKGPKARVGKNPVEARFTPADPKRFAPCVGNDVVSVADEVGGKSASPSGGLPNTGGPHLAILLTGAGLVAVGGGLAERGRRRA